MLVLKRGQLHNNQNRASPAFDIENFKYRIMEKSMKIDQQIEVAQVWKDIKNFISNQL